MKKEMLRMERVTYKEQGTVRLDNFSMTILAGEIMGLVPVNHYGLDVVLSLLKNNLPLYYGYVYYNGKEVNRWQKPGGTTNRISIIQNESCLAKKLTVADNVFVLRHGFKKWLIRPSLLKAQIAPFLEEIGVDIEADAYVENLSQFQCFVVELLKAVVAGNKLIVLRDVSSFISESELVKLHQIIRFYAGRGISFLYIAAHFEEAAQICDRTALMADGQITKYFSSRDKIPETFPLQSVEDYDRWVRQQFDMASKEKDRPAVLEIKHLYYRDMQDLNVRVAPGECLVIQDLDHSMLGLGEVFGKGEGYDGQILLEGKEYRAKDNRMVGIIQELPGESMLFSHMSYLDNLCFCMDHRFQKIWLTGDVKRSIVKEYASLLGEDVFYKRVGELTIKEKYDLAYTRILLQKPKFVLCIQPFKNAEVSMRSHIWELLERFLDKGIAVVILAVNLADSLALADRLIRVKHGKVQEVYDKKEFIKLPANTPWLYLYQEKYALERKEKGE